MRRYETFVIIDPDITQEQREPVLERVRELIDQQDGFLVFEDVWGERKLAYEIKKKARGYYTRFDYCGLAPLVNEIERFFRIDDRALKYMTVVLDKDVDLEKIKEEKAAAESQRQSEPAPPKAPEEAAPEPQKAPEEAAPEPQKAPEEAAPEPQESPEEAAPAELVQEQAQEKQEETAAQEPQAEEEAPASDTNESAEKTTPVEKKEEA